MITGSVPLKKFDFYPDKPKESVQKLLPSFKRHIATSKMDGYNLMLCNEGRKIETYSRRWNPLPVSDDLKEQWLKFVVDNKIPDNCIFNCEWMKMRAGSGDFVYDGPESIYFLTPYVMDGVFVGNTTYEQRRNYLEEIGLPVDDLSIDSKDIEHQLMLPEKADKDIDKFYERHVGVGRTEGVVIARKSGILTASQNDSVKSKDLLKIKWRSGDDGRTEFSNS